MRLGYHPFVGVRSTSTQRVRWQKLAADFHDNTFRFQILDEPEHGGDAWNSELRRVLETG